MHLQTDTSTAIHGQEDLLIFCWSIWSRDVALSYSDGSSKTPIHDGAPWMLYQIHLHAH